MGEWLKPAVLKTVNGVTRSGVRIPLPPPLHLELLESQAEDRPRRISCTAGEPSIFSGGRAPAASNAVAAGP
jgi:hypothetical protein